MFLNNYNKITHNKLLFNKIKQNSNLYKLIKYLDKYNNNQSNYYYKKILFYNNIMNFKGGSEPSIDSNLSLREFIFMDMQYNISTKMSLYTKNQDKLIKIDKIENLPPIDFLQSNLTELFSSEDEEEVYIYDNDSIIKITYNKQNRLYNYSIYYGSNKYPPEFINNFTIINDTLTNTACNQLKLENESKSKYTFNLCDVSIVKHK